MNDVGLKAFLVSSFQGLDSRGVRSLNYEFSKGLIEGFNTRIRACKRALLKASPRAF